VYNARVAVSRALGGGDIRWRAWLVAIHAGNALLCLRREQRAEAGEVIDFNATFSAAEQGERNGRLAELVREVFGNPFRPLPARKFPGEVRALAQACFDGDHAAYPVLADALADLGEDEAAEHCRLTGHVRGCHVVDWILGRA
jgi:hypothetical protein